ncbi:MAG TPA: ABC transporter ATP-binding protein [Candidatus Dormibacteraeota bacterium]|nr:ABC transporter ATP-binding protein [Candidatus Dormibacteraeota bacterium]
MSSPPAAGVEAESLIVVRDLEQNFGGVRAVAGVSFSIEKGRITGLIGPNGAGKSTTLDMIAGATRPSSGTISFQGRDITRLAAYQRARLGIVRTFQTSSEFARLTVMENLLVAAPRLRGERLVGALRGRWYWRDEEQLVVERARELLGRFEMTAKEDEYAGELSGGQKRLLEIMRGLMAEPEVLLLDEPMAGVNPSLARRIETYLLELHHSGLTAIMVEHELGTVERLCDPVIVMAEGRVLRQGTMPELRRNREVLDAYLIG